MDGSSRCRPRPDALKDTLDSRNASGSLERDASLETMGRLTDFIRVAEGWGGRRPPAALEQFAGAMVVPGREQMLHALKKAKADKLGKARDPDRRARFGVRVVPRGGGDVPRSRERRMPADPSRRWLLWWSPTPMPRIRHGPVTWPTRCGCCWADVAAVDDVAQAQRVTAGTSGFTRAVTRDGEVVVAGVAAIGGSSLSQSDLSLASRRDKALHEVAELKVELADLDAQVAQARDARDQARLAVGRRGAAAPPSCDCGFSRPRRRCAAPSTVSPA